MEKREREETERLALLSRAWKEGIDGGDAAEIDFAALKGSARLPDRNEAQRSLSRH